MQVIFTFYPDNVDPILKWDVPHTPPWRDESIIAALPDGAWNGPVVRLAEFIETNSGNDAQLILQKAKYFDYIGTNLSPKDCQRTDALGIAFHLMTSDGWVILQQRSPNLAVRPGQLGPSVSGTLEPSDCAKATRLSEIDINREIREELSVTDNEIDSITLMALIREPQRNGAPELMFRGKLKITAAELKKRHLPEGDLLLAKEEDMERLEDRSIPLDNLMCLLKQEHSAD